MPATVVHVDSCSSHDRIRCQDSSKKDILRDLPLTLDRNRPEPWLFLFDERRYDDSDSSVISDLITLVESCIELKELAAAST